jgi:hypothetical protein
VKALRGKKMSEQHWYIYQQSQQVGPFGDEQLRQLLTNKMIAQDAYLFKVGWKDWRPLEDCFEELGINGKAPPASTQRRAGAPRASIQGRVIVHNNGQLVIGAGVNISTTGIFVETRDEIFKLEEKLKISVRCEGIKKPFNVTAQVIRYNQDPRFTVGYGLRFENLDPKVKEEIEQLLKVTNQDSGKRLKSS